MSSPHCSAKIGRAESVVHWPYDNTYGVRITACGKFRYTLRADADRSRVTCLSCQRTKVFKERT